MEIKFKITKLALTTFTLNEMVVGLLKNYIKKNHHNDSHESECLSALMHIQKVNDVLRWGVSKTEAYDYNGVESSISHLINLEDNYDRLARAMDYMCNKDSRWRCEDELVVVFQCNFKKGKLKQKDALFFNECLAHHKLFRFEFEPEDNQIKTEESVATETN